MADIKIDGKLFQERINHFIGAWKNDKRAGDAIFAGVSSILIMMGKVEENPEFHKNNAIHVCRDQNPCASALLPHLAANETPTAMAPRLRVPYDPSSLHARDLVHCDHIQERYVLGYSRFLCACGH